MYLVDFSERGSEEQAYPQEDKIFVNLMENEVCMKEGKYELPLPFRSVDPELPDSIRQAHSRLKSVRRKMVKNDKFRHDYTTFMEDIGLIPVHPQL